MAEAYHSGGPAHKRPRVDPDAFQELVRPVDLQSTGREAEYQFLVNNLFGAAAVARRWLHAPDRRYQRGNYSTRCPKAATECLGQGYS